ncbi:hypothetical protein M3J09_002047 [Ascochyta lentis]
MVVINMVFGEFVERLDQLLYGRIWASCRASHDGVIRNALPILPFLSDDINQEKWKHET